MTYTGSNNKGRDDQKKTEKFYICEENMLNPNNWIFRFKHYEIKIGLFHNGIALVF